MNPLIFDKNELRFGSTVIRTEYPIRDARQIGDVIVVLYEPDSVKGLFRNLVAFSSVTGRQLWEAELPEPEKEDTYYRIATEDPLKVYSFSSFECHIDLSNGQISKKDFFR